MPKTPPRPLPSTWSGRIRNNIRFIITAVRTLIWRPMPNPTFWRFMIRRKSFRPLSAKHTATDRLFCLACIMKTKAPFFKRPCTTSGLIPPRLCKLPPSSPPANLPDSACFIKWWAWPDADNSGLSQYRQNIYHFMFCFLLFSDCFSEIYIFFWQNILRYKKIYDN